MNSRAFCEKFLLLHFSSYIPDKHNMKNLSLRLKLIISVLLFNLLLFIGMYININNGLTEQVKTDLSKKLNHIAASSSLSLSRKDQYKLYKDFRKFGNNASKKDSFKKAVKTLRQIQKVNNLKSDVYTVFKPSWVEGKMIFLSMSSEKQYIGNTVEATVLINKVYKTKMIQSSEVYKTDNGEWISGAAPIFGKKGNIISVLQVDFKADKEFAIAKAEAMNKIFLPVSILTLLLSGFLLFIINLLLKSLSSSITDNITNLSRSSEEIKESSDRTCRFSKELEKMNQEQLISVETTSHSLTEIDAMAKKTAKNTVEAVSLSNQAITKADEGRTIINKMLIAINNMTDVNSKVTTRISGIRSEISDIVGIMSKVGEKTNVINDIVRQTKLLSFNASVEAARAGEHGKGFAVLAQEIANLANMSGEASIQINNILKSGLSTVEEIAKTVESDIQTLVNETNTNITETIEVGNECKLSISEIFNNIKVVIQMMDEIKLATLEQAQGVGYANESVKTMHQHSSKYGQASEESETISKQLRQQLDKLENVVEFLEATSGKNSTKNAA